MAGQDDISTRWRIVRRLFHAALSIAVLYYWFPEVIIELDMGKWVVLLAGGIIVLCIEVPRLILGKQLPWGRPYELRRPASYAYAAFGAILVLLFFPPAIGAPAIASMAWADPVAGELRRKRLSRSSIGIACGAVYLAIALPLMALLDPGSWFVLPIALAMTITAVISENLGLKYLDDDFVMMVLPAIVGYILHSLLLSV
ncbi:MAG: hypothetical protein QXE45_06750 [Thermoplasmata archaeon]